MAKFYSEKSPQKLKTMSPKKETVDFLLNFSRALRVNTYQSIKFESFIN